MAEPGEDPTLAALMNEAFGPKYDAAKEAKEERRLERGLDEVASLTKALPEGNGMRWLAEETEEEEEAPAAAPKEEKPLSYPAVTKDAPLSYPAVTDAGRTQRATPVDETPRLCFHCAKPAPVAWCGKCGVAGYCGRDCQTADWKRGKWGGHKAQCAAYKVLGRQQLLATSSVRRAAIEALLASVRLHLCPFALAHGSGGTRGTAKSKTGTESPRGAVFVQLGCTLTQLALPAPRDCFGVVLPPGERSLLLHWVTLAEFDAEIVLTSPAFARARPMLAEAIAKHDDETEVVTLVRAHCGFVAVVVQMLVPERRVGITLAKEFEGREAVQIDLDGDA